MRCTPFSRSGPGGSTAQTARRASRVGARVLGVADVLPDLAPGRGKGNALWLSLYATSGDLICWVDADIRDFDPGFVTRLVTPLLEEPRREPAPGFVKGYYQRPIHGEPRGGGRVTELTRDRSIAEDELAKLRQAETAAKLTVSPAA